MNTGTANLNWYQGENAMYGDCIDPAGVTTYGVGDSADTNTCIGNTRCGYKYNWQAAVQLASANFNGNVLYPNGNTPTADGITIDDGNPVNNRIQGICPEGWHLPSGGTTDVYSEFVALDKAIGGTGVSQAENTLTKFWINETGGWKMYYSGWISSQANNGWGAAYHNRWTDDKWRDDWWSASVGSSTAHAYHLTVYSTGCNPQGAFGRWNGYSVRCVKN
jgi:uncharacterized protein (TIGR02145 family)